MTEVDTTSSWEFAILQIMVAWLAYILSNLHYAVALAALVLTCLQIYVTLRDKMGFFKAKVETEKCDDLSD